MVKPLKQYFFCGVGGSGMLPLAMIVTAQGHSVAGSDRALDQGRTPQKFDFLRSMGVELFPQDGSGLTSSEQILVASAAVESTVPDVAAANRHGAKRVTRAELLSDLFNEAPLSIAVGGTSGKSTTTAMIGWILTFAGKDPTIMNGAVMKNFADDKTPFASSVVGKGDVFVSEVDESDGSIALFTPSVSVLNNISEDHKSMDELRSLFGDFVSKSKIAVINKDDDETAPLAHKLGQKAVTYSLGKRATLIGSNLQPQRDGIQFDVEEFISASKSDRETIHLKMPGRHNVSNALAALATTRLTGVSLADAAAALDAFQGVKRRFEVVGETKGVTVIDDFGHNPDKIAATLRTLHDFDGRLLVMFQPHGFGPLRKMKDDFIACFVEHLKPEDHLLMPEPVYFGGTVDRCVSSEDIVAGVRDGGRSAEALIDRDACGERLLELAQKGDRIVIMGARDDTLSVFADELLQKISG